MFKARKKETKKTKISLSLKMFLICLFYSSSFAGVHQRNLVRMLFPLTSKTVASSSSFILHSLGRIFLIL